MTDYSIELPTGLRRFFKENVNLKMLLYLTPSLLEDLLPELLQLAVEGGRQEALVEADLPGPGLGAQPLPPPDKAEQNYMINNNNDNNFIIPEQHDVERGPVEVNVVQEPPQRHTPLPALCPVFPDK